MTKAATIMALHAEGKTTKQIAEAVYGAQLSYAAWDRRMAYVRVVLRQRQGGGQSQHDIAYRRSSERYQKYHRDYAYRRYHSDPEFRDAVLERGKAARRAARIG